LDCDGNIVVGFDWEKLAEFYRERKIKEDNVGLTSLGLGWAALVV
jgi:hypothetical protein